MDRRKRCARLQVQTECDQQSFGSCQLAVTPQLKAQLLPLPLRALSMKGGIRGGEYFCSFLAKFIHIQRFDQVFRDTE